MTNPKARPLLTPEAEARFKKSAEDLERVKGSLEILEKLGLNVEPIREKIKWTEEMNVKLKEIFRVK